MTKALILVHFFGAFRCILSHSSVRFLLWLSDRPETVMVRCALMRAFICTRPKIDPSSVSPFSTLIKMSARINVHQKCTKNESLHHPRQPSSSKAAFIIHGSAAAAAAAAAQQQRSSPAPPAQAVPEPLRR